jgi:hypothetical protein
MGYLLFDQYSLLHFAVGVIAYFWGFSLLSSFILHTVFEWIENTDQGIFFINYHLKNIWPGGKPAADNGINIIGDTISFVVGWILSRTLDIIGVRRGWYLQA